MATGYGEDGEGEIIDCMVRRVARVRRTPAEGEGVVRYDERPAWVWRDGNPYIRLPARAVDTEWLIRLRLNGYAGDVVLGRKRVSAGATLGVITTWYSGIVEWCAQERPAPERRSGKDRRKPTVTFASPITAPGPVVTSWAGGTGEAR